MKIFFVLIFLSLFFFGYASTEKMRDPFVSLEKLLLKPAFNKSISTKKRIEEIEKLLNALKLEGIIYSPQNPRVIISEKILKEGDKIREFTIKKILPHKVILQYGEREVELKIEIPSFKNILKSQKIKREANFKISLPYKELGNE
ncbi:MAG: hypothetical protein B6D55_05140 [Candidatus Omnitrophica bacterium 4484_70.2]|nr:MAG: hypothetical protein B6D55_05140 [Candidatus Omnitrophica bacterium 4484_70.2]